jgi:hypothetical protein
MMLARSGSLLIVMVTNKKPMMLLVRLLTNNKKPMIMGPGEENDDSIDSYNDTNRTSWPD